jgi:hypothetical protein
MAVNDDTFRAVLNRSRRRSRRAEQLLRRFEGGPTRPQEAAEPTGGGRDTHRAPSDGPGDFQGVMRARLADRRRNLKVRADGRIERVQDFQGGGDDAA